MYKGVVLKSVLRHTGTWLAAAWPPHHWCHRPAVLFRHLRLNVLPFQKGKVHSV